MIQRLLSIRRFCDIIRLWEYRGRLPPLRQAQLEEWQGEWSVLFNAFLQQVRRDS